MHEEEGCSKTNKKSGEQTFQWLLQDEIDSQLILNREKLTEC